jgi:hypothetical protein
MAQMTKITDKIQTVILISIHKIWVLAYLLKVCFILLKRGIIHDLSKFGNSEFSILADNITLFRKLPYATIEYEEYLKKIKVATDHHYKYNSHHFQYYDNIEQMGYMDLIELLCDWKAATKKYKGDNILQSIKYNKTKFNYSDQFEDKLLQLAKEIKIL